MQRMDEDKHYPEGAEPETTTPEGEQVEESVTPEPAPTEEKKPEEETPPTDTLPKKQRSIYDDYKEKKVEAQDAKALAEAEKTRADAAEAKAAELQALIDKKDDAVTPAEKTEAAKDLAEYAAKYDVPVESLEELTGIILAKLPQSEGMTPEELADWRASRAATKQTEEDKAIRETAPYVKTTLTIHDDAELKIVMDELVKLAHTKEFHDKEVEYIVWKKQADLAKLVSPKKPSFESGDHNISEAHETEVDFSSGKVTPEQAQKAIFRPKSTYEVRRSQ